MSDIENANGEKFEIKQMNHSRSVKNTLRGIHAAPWNKLIYVTHGSVKSVIVDLRPESSTFGKHETFTLGDENPASIFIPKGCGNSYLVLSEEADYTYLTDAAWEPGKEIGIVWNDVDLGIDWGTEDLLISERDKSNPTLRSAFPQKFNS
jgi:dTDP-4-dehydrorhamnose 3,5-epimerase